MWRGPSHAPRLFSSRELAGPDQQLQVHHIVHDNLHGWREMEGDGGKSIKRCGN